LYHIVIVTGKGGVGKSFAAALVAAQSAREGRRTLLVEMGEWSYLEKALNLPSRRSLFSPLKTAFGFDHAVWSGEDCLTDYVKYLIKVPWAADAFLKNAWMKSLIKVAPGLREISFLGKLTSQVRKHGPPLDYETIVVDAVSSGHYLSLVKTPRGLMEMTSVGPLREQSQGILEVLNDPKIFHTLVVTNLENFSVQESMELRDQLQPVLKSQIAFVANKVYPIPPGHPQNPGSEGARGFIEDQVELREFQEQQLKTFAGQKERTHQLPFYFSPLRETLKITHDNQRLFPEI